MSNTDRERILLLENNHQQMMEQFDELKTTQKTNHEEIKAMFTEMRQEVKEAMDKKSDIWVEKAFSWFLYTLVGTAVGLITYFFFQR